MIVLNITKNIFKKLVGFLRFISSMVLRREGAGITDEQLVKAILDNDQAAFAQLVDCYSPFLFAIIYPIVGNRHEAEDVLQETFFQVYRSLHQCRREGLKAWLARIATNKAIDWQRKSSRSKSEDILTGQDYLADLAQSARNEPEEKLLQLEEKQELIKISQKLPPIYQETLDKYYYQEKSYAEIAKEQGVAVKTVETRLYRLRQLLRKNWKGDKP